jgi:N,N-dimethylformamidase
VTSADLLGYADKLSVRPGDPIAFMLSTTAPEYHAEIVRLGADPSPLMTGSFPGRQQRIPIGSYVAVEDGPTPRLDQGLTIQTWLCPSTPRLGREQGIIASWSPAAGTGFALLLDDTGHLVFQLGDGEGRTTRVASPAPLQGDRWTFVAATYDPSGVARFVWREHPRGWVAGAAGEAEATCEGGLGSAAAPLLIGALALEVDAAGKLFPFGCYNGKIGHPRLWDRTLRPEEIDALAAEGDDLDFAAGLIGDWDFSAEIASPIVIDRSPSRAHGLAVNMPARGVTGHRWDGSETSWSVRPEHYDAIAFHEDDLEDCGWDADFTFETPSDLPTGLYAARLTAGSHEEEIPFYVRPARDADPAPILYLAPTKTYLAYANFRLNITNALAGRINTPGGGRLSHIDRLLMNLPQLGSSLYDSHGDGSAVFYSSRLRPIVTMRSDAIETATGGPRHFAADRYLLDWLADKGFPHDLATDEDLHIEGLDLLRPYRVIITGSHPEYWTGPMLDALEAFLAAGGRLMYLGGNGFYWVTAMDAERPHLIEIRRGNSGTRSWSSAPGEEHLSLTGEPGGLWRQRGRTPNRLCGVGFASQGWDAAASYTRLPGSFDPRVAFIFAGIGDDEIIGDFGLVLNGAAGDEIDRYDLSLGTPAETLRLATSEGQHSDAFQLVVEDTTESGPRYGGTTCPLVRSDIVYLESGNGGAVFSVGSINWIASLPHNAFANNVSRITENVLRRFADLPEA